VTAGKLDVDAAAGAGNDGATKSEATELQRRFDVDAAAGAGNDASEGERAVATRSVASEGERAVATRSDASEGERAVATRSVASEGERETQWEPSWLISIGRETWVYERPRYDSARLGYLRFGSKVQRDARPAGTSSCAGGWYRVAPEGYVCNNGRTATTDGFHPLAKISVPGPVREEPLPYRYALARKGVPVFLRDLPGLSDDGSVVTAGQTRDAAVGELPSIPAWFRQSLEIHGYPRPSDGSGQVVGLPNSGVAFAQRYAYKSGTFGLTPSMELVDQRVFERVEPSRFVGLRLDERTVLPVAFVKSKAGFLYRARGDGEQPRPLRSVAFRQAIPVVAAVNVSREEPWIRTVDGDYLRRDQVTIVSSPESLPSWVNEGRIWLDVSIETQTLVAYEGKVAKYVTLVSTGVDKLSDPKTSKATKQGVFSIVSKHVTITMDGQDEDHAYEMREVPWVQYFSEGYALHAAYWHDAFGQPKSHGCVNLSPLDARFLFHFTNPGVPVGWHGRTVRKDAATVYVH
jgi:lipoprotein-anchoring transpeptidase ErfK/SrfK